MLLKMKREEQSGSGCGQKTFRFLARMTSSGVQASPYHRMDSDVKKKKKKKGGSKMPDEKPEEPAKGKENSKKSKKGWKRVRQAALTTCRYIGMGAAHMSPATVYSSPDYYADPKYWNRSFSSSYKPKGPPPRTPHWTSNMMFSGW